MRFVVEQRKLTIPFVNPFRLNFTVWALRRRKINLVDWWDEEKYSRVLVFDNQPVRMSIVQEGTSRAPNLKWEALPILWRRNTISNGSR